MVLYNSVVIFFEAFLTCIEKIVVLHYFQANNDNFKKYVYGFCWTSVSSLAVVLMSFQVQRFLNNP